VFFCKFKFHNLPAANLRKS